MIIFLFLGVSLYDTSVHKWDYGLSLWTIVFTALFRPIGEWGSGAGPPAGVVVHMKEVD